MKTLAFYFPIPFICASCVLAPVADVPCRLITGKPLTELARATAPAQPTVGLAASTSAIPQNEYAAACMAAKRDAILEILK